MTKKYEFTDETRTLFSGKVLHRIKALVDIEGVVKAGELGGFIEKEKNLLHNGKAWVYGDALVYNTARIYDNAAVFGNAYVFGDAQVYDNAQVYGNARVFNNAEVFGDAHVTDNARVLDATQVFGDAYVCDGAFVYGDAHVFGCARVGGNAQVYDYAKVYGYAKVGGNARIYGKASVAGDVYVIAASIGDGAVIHKSSDYLCIGPLGSRDDTMTCYRTKRTIGICCGCFCGTLAQFVRAVKKMHGDNQFGQDYQLAIEFVKSKFNRTKLKTS